MYRHASGHVCIYAHNMCIDVCADMRTDMCTDVRTDVRIDMRTDMRIDECGTEPRRHGCRTRDAPKAAHEL